jgi:hypothetical protein
MGCYHIAIETDDFLIMFIRTLGEDNNVEHGWNERPIVIDGNDVDGKQDVGKVAHPQRTRKSALRHQTTRPASSSADKNSSLDRLADAIAETKKAENSAWTSENTRDTIYACRHVC